jgi:aflatoxin B1 aldehyde reductase
MRLELVYPWMCYHSSFKGRLGDEISLGGRLSQLEKTFESIKRGPLSAEAVKRI